MRSLTLVALFAVPAFAQTVYEWEDADGTHYTDDLSQVPKGQKKVEGRVIYARPTSSGLAPPKAPVLVAAAPESKSNEYQWRDRFIDARVRIDTIRQSQAALLASAPPRIECVPQPATPVVETPVVVGLTRAPARCQLNLLHDQIMVQVAQLGVELKTAELDLEQLERRASMEGIPREWRRGW